MIYREVTDHPCMSYHVFRSRSIGKSTHVRTENRFTLSRGPNTFVQLVKHECVFCKGFQHTKALNGSWKEILFVIFEIVALITTMF